MVEKVEKKVGVVGKTFGAVGWLFGVKYFNPVTWVKGDAYERGSVLKTAFKNAKESLTAELYNPTGYRIETFEDAVHRLNLSQTDLDQKAMEFKIASRLFYGFAASFMIYAMYHALHGGLLGTFCGLWAFTCLAFWGLKYAFNTWRVTQRRLAPFPIFLKKPEFWIV